MMDFPNYSGLNVDLHLFSLGGNKKYSMFLNKNENYYVKSQEEKDNLVKLHISKLSKQEINTRRKNTQSTYIP